MWDDEDRVPWTEMTGKELRNTKLLISVAKHVSSKE